MVVSHYPEIMGQCDTTEKQAGHRPKGFSLDRHNNCLCPEDGKESY
jgi:hypothetical protein